MEPGLPCGGAGGGDAHHSSQLDDKEALAAPVHSQSVYGGDTAHISHRHLGPGWS